MKLTSRRIVVAVVVCAAAVATGLIAVSAAGTHGSSSSTAVQGVAETSAMLRGIPQHGTVLGSPGAPATIYEYADLQCPYCARFSLDTLPTLVEDYVRTGKVKLVFRGVAIIGPDSLPPLQAAYAAAEQNRLWDYTELVYHNQGEENTGWVSDGLLRSIGEAVAGLDVGQMMDARASASVQAAVDAAQNGWVDAHLRYTPTFVVVRNDGERSVVEGALPVHVFRHAITGS